VRAVDHSTAYGQDSGIGLAFERFHNSMGVFDLRRRWGEGRIDHGDLSGVDRELAREAFAGGRFGFHAKAVLILEVGEYAVDRLDSGRDSSCEAE
jgi:hypothetical protein